MPTLDAFSASVVDAVPAAGRYLHWGVVSVSITNLLIVVAMLVVFALALILPFPGHRAQAGSRPAEQEDDAP